MWEKEKKKIESAVLSFIRSMLLNNFKNRKGQNVITVDGFSLVDIGINEGESELREMIVVDGVSVWADVWVAIDPDSKTNNTLALSASKGLRLSYDKESGDYVINDDEDIFLIDKTIP